MTDDGLQRAPYPGLRAFRREETDLFFGREDCINAMVDRLAETRFLAVLGSSGTGKSSLVRTGLLDALELGLMANAGSRWRIVDFRPGGAPLKNLARRLLETEDPEGKKEPSAGEVDLLRALLVRGPRSIIEWCRAGHVPSGTNLLLLVDQFEELFRYQDYAGREEAEAFVALLLESARTKEFPIYVAITMRSEYLGACALIEGLADAINAGMFLTPRMTREQCREAIVGPAAVCNIDIEPALVNRLLNDLANFAPWSDSDAQDQFDRIMRRADQLPLLQYTLNRMWMRAREHSGGDRITLTLADYNAIGGLSGALNAHANQLFEQLGKERWPIIEWVFRALTAGSTIADAVRRPTRFDDLVALCGGDEANVRAVIDAFRAPGVNFLVPESDSKHRTLKGDDYIDISHESLIRQWKKLSEWLEKEARAAQQWRRLIDRHATGEPLRGRELANLVAWRAETQPNAAWAKRYGGDYPAVISFLEHSDQAQKRKRILIIGTAAAVFVLMAAQAVIATHYARLAEQSLADSRRMENAAVEAAKSAEQSSAALIEALDHITAYVDEQAGDEGVKSGMTPEQSLEEARKLVARHPDDPNWHRYLSVRLRIYGNSRLQAGDIDGARNVFEENLQICRTYAARAQERWQEDLAIALGKMGQVHARQGNLADARRFYEEGVTIGRALVERAPDAERLQNNLQTHVFLLGDVLGRIPDNVAARDAYAEGVALRRARAARDLDNIAWQRELSAGLDKLGATLRRLNDDVAATQVFEEEVGIDRKVLARDSNDRQSQQDLAWSLIQLGDMRTRARKPAEALPIFQEALALRRTVLSRNPQSNQWQKDVANVLDKVGAALRDTGDLAGARRAFEEQLELDRRVAEADPGNTGWQRDWAWSLTNLGDFFRVRLNDREGARKFYEDALDVRRRVLARNPQSTLWQKDISSLLDKIGNNLRVLNRLEEARRAFEEELAIDRALADSAPDNVEWQRDLAWTLVGIGDLKVRFSPPDREGAHRAYDEALHIRRRVLARDRDNTQYLRDLSTVLDKAGNNIRQMGRVEDARRMFEEELSIDRVVLSRDRDNIDRLADLAWSLNRVASVLRQLGELPGARKHFEELLTVDRELVSREPTNKDRHTDLSDHLATMARLLLQMEDIPGARRAYEEAFLDDERWIGVTRRDYAKVQNTANRSELVRALDDAAWHGVLGSRPQPAAKYAEEALIFEPGRTAIKVNLAHAYLFLGRYAEAKALYQAVKDVPRGGNDANRKYADEIKDDFKLFRQLEIAIPEMRSIEREVGL